MFAVLTAGIPSVISEGYPVPARVYLPPPTLSCELLLHFQKASKQMKPIVCCYCRPALAPPLFTL